MGGSNEFVECLGGVWQPRVVLGQLPGIFRSAMSGRFNQSHPNNGGINPPPTPP